MECLVPQITSSREFSDTGRLPHRFSTDMRIAGTSWMRSRQTPIERGWWWWKGMKQINASAFLCWKDMLKEMGWACKAGL